MTSPATYGAGRRTVLVHPDAQSLAAAVAARLVTRLIDLQSVRAATHVALTGGTIGIALLAELAVSPAADAVDFSTVHFWWGDERFLPAGDAERNETQARGALLDSLVASGRLPEANIHPMPALDVARGVTTPQAAAAQYAVELGQFGLAQAAKPGFDITLLGMGTDGHIASLFPGFAQLNETQRAVVGVTGSPKPPPERVTLTLPVLDASRETWLVVAGADRAAAVGRALTGRELPAGRVGARERLLWLVDVAALPEAG